MIWLEVRWRSCSHDYNILRNIDEKLAAGTITANQAAEERKEILCISLGDAQYMGSISTFDKEVIKFANYLRDEKQYDVNASGNLFDIHQEAMCYKYYWEHQATEEMTVFREGALTTFMTMALVDRMLLMARIEKLEEIGRKWEPHRRAGKSAHRSQSGDPGCGKLEKRYGAGTTGG